VFVPDRLVAVIFQLSSIVAALFCINFPVVVSNLAIALSVALAGQATSQLQLPQAQESTQALVPLSHIHIVSVLHRTAYHQSDQVGYAVFSAVISAK